ncbi:MAG: Trifunctional nucleotide phosphoesterase protein YfkN [Desulfovibrio sp.]
MTRRALVLLCLVILWPQLAGAASVPVTIFYTSDAHGHIISNADTIGLDTVAALRRSVPGSVLVDAGDFLHGSLPADIDEGASVVALMRQAGYFAVALGNHEFSFGLNVLQTRLAETAAPPGTMHMLSANTFTNGALLCPATAEIVVNDVRVCFLGLTTPKTKVLTAPGNVAGISFEDPLIHARTAATNARANGCDIVVALTHLGRGKESSVSSTNIAEQTPGVDVVIDGHDHTELSHTPPGGVPVFSPKAHGKSVGKLVVEFDTVTRKITSIRNVFLYPENVTGLTPDASLRTSLAALQNKLDTHMLTPVAELSVTLPGNREILRTNGTPLGNLVADAVREATGADIALINAGSIREGLPAGMVREKDLATALPFKSKALVFSLTGEELLAVLEHGFSALPEASGVFPQVSGIMVEIALNATSEKRIHRALVGGKELRLSQSYRVAVNDFMAAGGDGYPVLPQKIALTPGTDVREAVAAHLRRSAVIPKEARILIKAAP